MADHVIWYKNEAIWQAFKDLSEDKDHFGSSYTEWASIVQGKIEQVACKGINLIKVELDPLSFAQWCQDNKLTGNGQTRSRFLAETHPADSASGA